MNTSCVFAVPVWITCLLSIGSATAGETRPATGETRPNFVFILADDLGYMDIGANNPKTFYETPHIDRIAATGMRFTDGYAACPVCSPTRASILTGKYPARIGITDYIGSKNQPDKWKRKTKLLPAAYRDRLPLAELTIAERLKAAGYATFFAGKWHLGPEGDWPEDQGFDINMGGCSWGSPSGGNRYFSPYGNPRLPDGPPGENLPDRLAAETVKFIENNRDRRFLAYLSFYSVHIPLMARKDLVEKYLAKKKRLQPDGPIFGTEGESRVRLVQEHEVYAAMIEAMDQAVGKVLSSLDRLGLADRTVVIFTSDNGGLSTAEGSPTSNLPLRAGKGWLYEGGIREPLLVCWPGVTKAGSTCSVPVTSTDFVPTLLEMAGQPPSRERIDGVSMAPALRGDRLQRGPLFWHYPHYGNQGGRPGGAIRDGDWKLIQWFEGDRTELFNLREDLSEQHNVAESHPQVSTDLLKKLRSWQKEVRASFPTTNPSGKQ
jgi:arylsulfatase A-like enzyme